MAESHDALQAQFVELTGADAATAHFYLESSGWKLDVRSLSPSRSVLSYWAVVSLRRARSLLLLLEVAHPSLLHAIRSAAPHIAFAPHALLQ